MNCDSLIRQLALFIYS